MKIGIVGAGHMGSAIIKGIYKANHISMEDVYIKSGKSPKAKTLADSVNANIVNEYEELSMCEIIILAVNANASKNVLESLNKIVKEKTTIISIVASLSINEIEESLNKTLPIVCLIPNTAVEVNQGVLGYSSNFYADDEQINFIFRPLGKVIKVPEEQLGILGTIAGCGPAFLDLFIEGLSDGAVVNGMSRDLSYNVIFEMITGSVQLALQSQKHPGQLKDEVTSPGGSTIKGVSILEKHQFRYALIDAVNKIENNFY